MAMADNGRVVCKCTAARRSFFCFREVSFDDKPNRRNHLRNVSAVPVFKNGIFTRCSPSVAGNSILSMDARENPRSSILPSSRDKRIPIYVMMPVDAFCIDGSGRPRIRKIKALTVALKALKLAGVHGIAVEVWWGIVERFSPLAYDWSLYEELFKLISESGLKLHVALSFHSNVNSSSSRKGGVSLPLWIVEIGDQNKHIYYRDQKGFSNDDYLTLGVDHVPLFCGRTALQCYEDFMSNFAKKFESFIGTVIEEISVGLGPSGELRYPAHPFGDGRWKFPGIGEFQCYDKYMMDDLKMAACKEGKPQWGERGPQNAGCYNSLPSEVPFFEEGEESFLSDYGCFFLEWYSGRLLRHADDILAKAANFLKKYQENKQTNILLAAKIGGIYWWYQTVSHPAELTAGYYNTALRDGYDPVASILSRHGAALHVSCLEMTDGDNPASYLCSPEGLLQQIWTVSKKRVHLIGRNTNERFDRVGLWQIHANCYHSQAEAVRSFTYFRMNDKIFRAENWNNFVPFVRKMSANW
ncbi:inactive beta-amylase 4, chloroplastic-like isoform X1 [Pyrus x bretschneideri]|uniref:inactive beta-amylase 4, chloroplastic-like isoform X1 n=2 Tax=Pyrus x bretschneideri TaxID=225117 RepID=UPI00202FAC39|nr:inactive beta-amylase 4, chloroplastic-like isoform X1 [Pyrus x bretschneideri]